MTRHGIWWEHISIGVVYYGTLANMWRSLILSYNGWIGAQPPWSLVEYLLDVFGGSIKNFVGEDIF